MASIVRELALADVSDWKRLRRVLWQDLSDEENDRDCASILADANKYAVYVDLRSMRSPFTMPASAAA